MTRVLLVKMSSLGDVVHTLPGLTDAMVALGPDAVSFDWVVEEAFRDVPARHPAVADVIPVAWRRWRGALGSSVAEMRAFLRRLRGRRYDVVLDAQGLLKSAAVVALARGDVSIGLSRASAREGAASLFYRRRVAVSRDGHAIDRIRDLFAGALDYPRPERAAEFLIGAAGVPPVPAPGEPPRCLLLQGTTWKSKQWPLAFWRDVSRRARAAGFRVLVPWSGNAERRRAADIAAPTGASVMPPLSLGALTGELSRAALVVGVDSGLAHLAAALGVPTVVIYGSSSATLTGARGARVCNLQAEFPCSPCLSPACAYRGAGRSWQGNPVAPPCYASVGPDRVWQAASQLAEQRNADRLLHL